MPSSVIRERDIEKYLVLKVKGVNGRAYKWTSPANRGVTDRIVFIYGTIWFIELKRPGGKLSLLQQYFLEFLSGFTDKYRVLSSKEEVDEWMLEAWDLRKQ